MKLHMKNKNLEKNEKINNWKLSIKKVLFITLSIFMIIFWILYSLCWWMIFIIYWWQLSIIPHLIFALLLIYMWYKLYTKQKNK